MPFDAYEIYCQHCLARGMTPPTRDWWDWASAQQRPRPALTDDDRARIEHEREERGEQ